MSHGENAGVLPLRSPLVPKCHFGTRGNPEGCRTLWSVEPVFGIIKSALRFRQFLLRGLQKVSGEWNQVCLAYNLKRLHTLRQTALAT